MAEEPKRATGGGGALADQFAWVREAIDGLRHSQNLAVAVLGGSIALMAAVFGGFMIWQAGEIKGLSDDMRTMEQRIVASVNTVGRDVVDVRDRVSKIEGQLSGIEAQLVRIERQRTMLNPVDPIVREQRAPVAPRPWMPEGMVNRPPGERSPVYTDERSLGPCPEGKRAQGDKCVNIMIIPGMPGFDPSLFAQ